MKDSLVEDYIFALQNNTLMNIVACCNAQIWDRDPSAPLYVPARDAFLGPMFIQASECLGTIHRCMGEEPSWLILSARFGFIKPEWNMPKYTARFTSSGRMGDVISNDTMAQQWVEKGLNRYDTLMIWGPTAYCTKVQELVSSSSTHFVKFICPAKGLRTGSAVKALKDFRKSVEERIVSVYGTHLKSGGQG